MKKRKFVSFVSWLIIASFLAETIGCSTFQQVENWKEYPEKAIRVETKHGATYELKQWQILASGDITAEGEVHYPGQIGYWERPKYSPFRGTIPADSIATVEVWKTDDAVTCVAMVLVPLGLILIGKASLGQNKTATWFK